MDHLKKQPIFGKIDDTTTHPFSLPKFGAIPLPKPSQKHASESGKAQIDDLASLQEHLQTAMMVELSTIPMYLYAMYSVDVSGTPDEQTQNAQQFTFSVLREQMLHLILAGNVLKATGASPKLYLAPHWPTYPMDMAGHSGSLVLNLQSLDLQQLECFLAVEAPTTQGAPLEPDDYDTLGQFYEAIQDALIRLRPHYTNYEYQFAPSDNVFNTDPYGGGGIVVAEDNGSALSALQIIIDQGEGFNETQFENPPGSLANADKGWVMTLAHYYKFKSIYDTKPLPKIYPNLLNPTSNTYKDPNIALTSYWVDSVYCFFLLVIEQTWQVSRDTAPTERQQLLNMYFTIMISIIKPVATWLAQQPVPEQPGKNAGAAFNFYDFRVAYKTDPQMTPLKQVKHQADLAIQSFPTAGKTVPQVLVDANSQCMNLTELPFPWQD